MVYGTDYRGQYSGYLPDRKSADSRPGSGSLAVQQSAASVQLFDYLAVHGKKGETLPDPVLKTCAFYHTHILGQIRLRRIPKPYMVRVKAPPPTYGARSRLRYVVYITLFT